MTSDSKCFFVIIACCHVLICLVNEFDLFGIILVAEFIISNLQKTIIFGISYFSSGNDCNLPANSEKYATGVSLKNCFKTASLHHSSKYSLHWNNFLVSYSCHYDLKFYHPLYRNIGLQWQDIMYRRNLLDLIFCYFYVIEFAFIMWFLKNIQQIYRGPCCSYRPMITVAFMYNAKVK